MEMILYRVIPKSNKDISNQKINGLNSFSYQNDEYIHFFILPEHVEYLQFRKYSIDNIDSIILKCDIPYHLLEFGVGLYSWYYHFKLVPFLEARIKKQNFNNSFIKETSNYVKHEYKNNEIYKRYLINCIYNQTVFKYQDNEKKKLIINKHFNFLHYFNQDDLLKEDIIVPDYPENKSFTELKKQNLTFIKKLFVETKEGLEMFKENDINFYDIDYNEKRQYTKNL